MQSVFLVVDKNEKIVGWAGNRIEAIGTKEHLERKNKVNLAVRRVWRDEEGFKEAMAVIFGK